ncbi:hypothetical protein L9F63_008708, partial [Diploptera punctata]
CFALDSCFPETPIFPLSIFHTPLHHGTMFFYFSPSSFCLMSFFHRFTWLPSPRLTRVLFPASSEIK